LGDNEIATSITSCHDSDFILVGTGFFDSEEDECASGRILGISLGNDGYSMAWEINCNGSVLSLVELQGKFAAAINSKVTYFS
jgi:hypothetical protein